VEPPWKQALKPKHRQQEERINRLGGQRQPASGRLWRFRRDGKLLGFLIEARTTEKDSYTLKLKELQAIEQEAHMTPPGLLPAMQIDIQGHSYILTRLIDFMDREARLGIED
jgi:hypothetical protein